MIDKDKLERLEAVAADLRDGFSRFQQSVELLAQVQEHLNETLRAVKGLDEEPQPFITALTHPQLVTHKFTDRGGDKCELCAHRSMHPIHRQPHDQRYPPGSDDDEDAEASPEFSKAAGQRAASFFRPTFPPPGEHHHASGLRSPHVFQSKTGEDSCDVCGCRLDHAVHVKMQPLADDVIETIRCHCPTVGGGRVQVMEGCPVHCAPHLPGRNLRCDVNDGTKPQDDLISLGVQPIGMDRKPLTCGVCGQTLDKCKAGGGNRLLACANAEKRIPKHSPRPVPPPPDHPMAEFLREERDRADADRCPNRSDGKHVGKAGGCCQYCGTPHPDPAPQETTPAQWLNDDPPEDVDEDAQASPTKKPAKKCTQCRGRGFVISFGQRVDCPGCMLPKKG